MMSAPHSAHGSAPGSGRGNERSRPDDGDGGPASEGAASSGIGLASATPAVSEADAGDGAGPTLPGRSTAPTPPGPPDNRPLLRELRRIWRAQRRAVHLRGLSVLIIVVTLGAAAVVAIDWRADLWFGWRLALAAGWLAGVLAVLWYAWLARLRPFDPVAIALRAERTYPQLNSTWISCVQLTQAPPASGESSDASPHMVASVCRTAAALVGRVDRSRLVDRTAARLCAIIAVGVVLAAAVAARQWPLHTRAGLLRLVTPTAGADYPPDTWLVVAPVDVSVEAGGAVALTIALAGDVPDEATLRLRAPGELWESVQVRPDAAGHFTHRLERVTGPLEYRWELGQITTNVHRIRIAQAAGPASATSPGEGS